MQDRRYQQNIKTICFIIFLLLLSSYYIYHQNTQLVASDNCSMFPMLIDFLNGNFLLKNWVVGTASFAFTDTIWCLPGILLGVHIPKIMSFCAALFHSAFVSILLYMTLSDEYERGNLKGFKIPSLFTVIYLMLIAVVPYSGFTIENPTYLYLNLNLHAGAFMFIAIEMLLLYLWKESDYTKSIYPVVFTVYGILGQMSDGTPLMIFFGPLCVYGAYYLIWPKVERNKKKDLFLIIDSVVIVVIASLLNKLITYIGVLTILGVIFSFNNIETAVMNCKTLVIKLLNLFGYDVFYGIKLTPYLLIVCLIISLIAVSVIYQLVMALRSKPDRLGFLLSLGIVSNVIGAVFISSGYDTVSARHIMSIPFFGSALIVKLLLSIPRNKAVVKKILVAVVMVISCGYSLYNLAKIRYIPDYGADGEAVADYIDQKGGGNGYGALWVYTTISAYTDCESTLIPVWWNGWGNGFFRYKILLNTEWYNESDIHYVVVLSNEGDLYADGGNRTDFTKFAGEPDEDRVFGIYEVMYYEQDLSQYDMSIIQ